ncbi:MAG: hypothetical protein M3Q03_00890 [Chloroflexota bacterium]|nr:hypothetical protein [Chloroflexota bacterium]
MGSRREETAQTPTERDAATLVRSILRTDVHAVVRFPTGLAHYVYDVVLGDGLRVVARLAKANQGDSFTSAVYWHQRLRSRGVPLPRLRGPATQRVLPLHAAGAAPGPGPT